MMDVLSYALSKKYTNEQINEQKLKVAKLEQELNNYKSVMSQVNINQEATQKATGYGIVSLPPNAAEGQINDIKIEGKTYRNVLEDYFGKRNSWLSLYGELIDNDFIKGTADASFKNFWLNAGIITLKPNTQYTIFVEVRKNTLANGELYITSGHQNDAFGVINSISSGRTGIFKFLATTKENLSNTFPLRMYISSTVTSGEIEFRVMLLEGDYKNENISYIRGTKSTLGAIRLKSVNEDETKESTLYIHGRDEEGNILELRSLPDGTKDEINVTDRKLIKRIGEKSNITSGTIINFTDMAEGGTYYAWNEDGETETGTKGDTLGINATQLIYQLAEPVEIPVQVSGNLLSYPSGTVYVENVVADTGLYSDGITVLHQDLPIKSIEKISKVDYTTGLEYKLDPTQAVISSDGLSFTHPALANGDIVFFVYEYSKESTIPEMTVEYYDSRFVVKDSVTGKFYHWNLVVANGQWDIQLTEV